jgi:hypothetical protein
MKAGTTPVIFCRASTRGSKRRQIRCSRNAKTLTFHAPHLVVNLVPRELEDSESEIPHSKNELATHRVQVRVSPSVRRDLEQKVSMSRSRMYTVF